MAPFEKTGYIVKPATTMLGCKVTAFGGPEGRTWLRLTDGRTVRTAYFYEDKKAAIEQVKVNINREIASMKHRTKILKHILKTGEIEI